jgi:HEAT repeat protein
MPKTVVSIKSKMRDHSITVPTPENTVRFGVPNACNLCHDDKSADWAVGTMRAWYPGSTARQKLMTRADVFFRARKRDKTVLERLYLLADDKDESPLARANALGYLDRFPTDPRVIPALLRATVDEHPMVRATAISRLGQIEDAELARIQPTLAAALGDPSRIVRMNATLSLMNLGVPTLEGEAGKLLENAKRDLTIRAALYPDDPETQRNLGMFHILNRDADGAANAFWASLQIAPDQPGIQYFLALARIGQERYDEAKDLLKKVDRKDPYRPHARALLKKLKD